MKFNLIYPDPPWWYNFSKSKKRKVKYRCEKTEEMCSWPVQEILKDDALCFMWATWPKLKDAIALMEAWGFEYITCAFVWRKMTSTGKDEFGLGHYTRGSTEMVLLGKRGKGLPRKSNSVRQIIHAQIGKDTSKPKEVAERIDKLVGPDIFKLEMFARRKANSTWMATGLEYDGMTLVESIEYFKNL